VDPPSAAEPYQAPVTELGYSAQCPVVAQPAQGGRNHEDKQFQYPLTHLQASPLCKAYILLTLCRNLRIDSKVVRLNEKTSTCIIFK